MAADNDHDTSADLQIRSGASDPNHAADMFENFEGYDKWFLAEHGQSRDGVQTTPTQSENSLHPELFVIILLWVVSIAGGAAALYYLRS